MSTSVSAPALSPVPPVPLPVLVRMHERDNVAIVGNDGGLPAGTELPGPIGRGDN